MARHKLEYIWLDGYKPTQSLRSKVLIRDDFSGKVEDAPEWCFDGSSTGQAEGGSSDCLLKPVFVCPDPTTKNGFLVMNEVLNADRTPHESNGRATIDDDDADFWFGFEQEYTLWDIEINSPLGFPAAGYFPPPQGPFYCSVGAEFAVGRDIVDEHTDACIEAGLNIEGTNAEVMKGQWEYQIFAKGAAEAGDQIWVARYILEKIGEKHGVRINLHPKPIKGDWNGSGMHANFSNGPMREKGDKQIFVDICEEFGKFIPEHISVYGASNDERLTGEHETQSIEKYSYGVSDRGASIRIPISTEQDGWVGRLEDRRTASNADPYKVAARIIKTVKSALK
jgi:glutamine synthetase